MNPSFFPEVNCRLVPPRGMTEADCSDLYVHRGEDRITSCWRPTDEERAAIARGEPVWLQVMGKTTPPVAVFVGNPFAPPQPGEFSDAEVAAAFRAVEDAQKRRDDTLALADKLDAESGS